MRFFVAVLACAWLAMATAGCERSADRSVASDGEQSVTECRHDRNTFRCVKFLKNYDADTITFDIPGVHPLIGAHISVRVNGIDAPEIKGRDECEKRSARNARHLVENILSRAKRIDLEHVERDKYFRILADVVVDGRNLKDILLKNGLAYEYHGATKRKIDWCKSASGEARLPAKE
jgi:endonuclease YncB( thermonuclease family)